MRILQARILEWVAMPPPGDLPNPAIKPRSPALQADSLPAEPQGSPKILKWLSSFLIEDNIYCVFVIYDIYYVEVGCC